MSNIPMIPKQQTPAITSDQLDAAIAEIRQYFPDDAELAKVSDAEIKQKVGEYLKSKQTFTPALSAPSAERIEALTAIEDSCPYTIGVVVVDCIFMILGFVGLHATNSEAIARAAAKEVGEEVVKNLPKWLKLINALKEAGSPTAVAKAIFNIGSAAYSAGMFRGILASIASSMKWWDWIITGVAAVAQIAALVLTDGAAFIAEVALNATAIAYVVSDSVKAGQACIG